MRAAGRGWRVRAGVACAVVALGLAGCADKPGEGAGKNAGSGPRPIKLAGVFCLCHLGPYVAWKQGFFEKEGVPVEKYIFPSGGADTFQALASGDVDFGVSGLDAIIRGREKGVKVRSVASVYPEFYAIAVRKDRAGDIKTVADLKGRRVGISKVGSASWAFLEYAVAKAGLGKDDVQVLPLGAIDTIVAGLKTGTVDAAVVWEPGISQIEDMGIGTDIVDVLRPEDHRRLLGSASSMSMTLAASDELIDKNPVLVQRVVKALDEADAWIKGHSAEQVADVIAPLAQGIDRRVLVEAVKASIPAQPRSTAISRSAYQSSASVLSSAGVIDKVPPLEEPISCRFTKCVK
jgi:NitT/TauT family transport system substrate-binding protein